MRRRAAIGAPVMVSVSAPTALAVLMADAAGITLVAIARADEFEVFMHPRRISDRAVAAMTTVDGPNAKCRRDSDVSAYRQ
jgi:hypothetical protein